jgi:hypothetical protein
MISKNQTWLRSGKKRRNRTVALSRGSFIGTGGEASRKLEGKLFRKLGSSIWKLSRLLLPQLNYHGPTRWGAALLWRLSDNEGDKGGNVPLCIWFERWFTRSILLWSTFFLLEPFGFILLYFGCAIIPQIWIWTWTFWAKSYRSHYP